MNNVIKKDLIKSETKDHVVLRKERIAFYFASFFRDMSYVIVGGFLLLFYIDIMGFAGTAALIFIPVISRIWDGVNDPLLGVYYDRRKYTKEKARPIFKSTVLIGSITLIMLFFAPTFSQNTNVDYIIKIVWATISYFIFEGFQTLNGTAFMTLYNNISPNSHERTHIISRARLFSTLGSSLIAGIIPILLSLFRNDDIVAKTYIYLGVAVFVSFSFMLYNFLMYRYVKERIVTPSKEVQKIVPMLKKFFKNKPLLLIIASTTISGLINLGVFGLYFYTYNMGNPALATIVGVIAMPSFFLGSLIVPNLVKFYDKRDILIGSILLMVISNLFYLLGGYKPQIWLIITVGLIGGVAVGIKNVLYWSMISDTVDYGEWKTHVRNDGIVYAIEGAVMKIVGSFGFIFVAIAITAINFVPNALTQTESTMKGLFYIPIIVAIIVSLLSLIPLKFYNLNRKNHAAIVAELQERRNAQNPDNTDTSTVEV